MIAEAKSKMADLVTCHVRNRLQNALINLAGTEGSGYLSLLIFNYVSSPLHPAFMAPLPINQLEYEV